MFLFLRQGTVLVLESFFFPVMQLNYFFYATIAYFSSFLYVQTLTGSGVTLLPFVLVISRKCMLQNNVIGNIPSDRVLNCKVYIFI